MVVFESAVCRGVIFSSARAADARLTTPTAARPTVHLLNFIWFLRCCLLMFFCLVPVHFRVKNRLPRHRMVQLRLKIGKIRSFDNIFFGVIEFSQGVEVETVVILASFLSHSWTGFGHKPGVCGGGVYGAKW